MVSSIDIYICHNLTSDICWHTVGSIWPIDRTLLHGTTPGQSWPESNDNEGLLHISQMPMALASPSDGLMSNPGRKLVWRGAYRSAQMQSVYSTATDDWAKE